MTIIDAHQHFWRLARGDYRFPRAGDPVLYRDFLPSDLEPLLNSAGVGQTVLVQATDTFAETRFLLDLAARTPFIAGVVGWWDPRGPGGIEALRALAIDGALVGVRPMLQGLDDISFLLTTDAIEQFEQVADLGLVCDALIDPRQLETINALCRHVPSLEVVIDHMGKPWRTPAGLEEWGLGMRALAERTNCAVKVSGYPFATPSAPGESVDVLVRLLRGMFGAERLLWGSDWPVAEREGGYRRVLDNMQALFDGAEREAVFGSNAARLYKLTSQETGQTR